ncbi:Uncharacterized protein APZ42_011567 [Daphnia magna]|uniref:Uncharacterized protein n=1 Tax=Daphnia magna TaxID=35525 RepID=A0A162ST94_9CRUS|nr:Uncharacterized protein APZ42_011567 [Daphnia magna]
MGCVKKPIGKFYVGPRSKTLETALLARKMNGNSFFFLTSCCHTLLCALADPFVLG